ncbi:MAG: hypothetical protein J0665_16310 [Deltaproteobacteria bacterium]|nr:hypothetical protein [Deltaproteobacteria bacterium]
MSKINPEQLRYDSFPLFDSHFHIIDHRFPLTPNNGYLPDDLVCAEYRARMAPYDLRGGAVVSGSFQAFDQSYLLDALHTLGPLFVGVTQLPSTVSDQEILDLDSAGVRVKVTGFGRVDFDVPTALRELYAANPGALMFGTDLPSTRAARPYRDGDFLLVAETLGDDAARAVFFDNAAEFYRVAR